jgi:hypothetical protein
VIRLTSFIAGVSCEQKRKDVNMLTHGYIHSSITMAITPRNACVLVVICLTFGLLLVLYAKFKQKENVQFSDNLSTSISNISREWHRKQSLNRGTNSIDSCRKETLRIIFRITGNSSITDPDGLHQARECWKAAFSFYLSYPMEFTYGSHVIPLLASLWVSDGAILELGSGWYSTPVAHRISDVQNRTVLTADSTHAWLKYFLFFASRKHSLYFVNKQKTPVNNDDGILQVVNSWGAIGQQKAHWGFIFVDHAPAGQRIKELQRLRKQADLFLIHDTEPIRDNIYMMEKPLSTFKYRTTFGPGWAKINTDAVSDTRPELIRAVKILCEWSTGLLKYAKKQ